MFVSSFLPSFVCSFVRFSIHLFVIFFFIWELSSSLKQQQGCLQQLNKCKGRGKSRSNEKWNNKRAARQTRREESFIWTFWVKFIWIYQWFFGISLLNLLDFSNGKWNNKVLAKLRKEESFIWKLRRLVEPSIAGVKSSIFQTSSQSLENWESQKIFGIKLGCQTNFGQLFNNILRFVTLFEAL